MRPGKSSAPKASDPITMVSAPAREPRDGVFPNAAIGGKKSLAAGCGDHAARVTEPVFARGSSPTPLIPILVPRSVSIASLSR